MTMTPDELYRRANTEMTRAYESGIRCMDTAMQKQSVRFFRDYSEGEIDGIANFSQSMYLATVYNYDNEDEAGEDKSYTNYCNRIRERAKDLKDLLIQYAVRFI